LSLSVNPAIPLRRFTSLWLLPGWFLHSHRVALRSSVTWSRLFSVYTRFLIIFCFQPSFQLPGQCYLRGCSRLPPTSTGIPEGFSVLLTFPAALWRIVPLLGRSRASLTLLHRCSSLVSHPPAFPLMRRSTPTIFQGTRVRFPFSTPLRFLFTTPLFYCSL